MTSACKIYEIRGSDPTRTAGAVRCHRDAVAEIELGGRHLAICANHRDRTWQLFDKRGWAYAVNLDAAGQKAKPEA